MTGIDGEMAFLSRSDNRTQLLSALRSDQPLDRDGIEQAVDSSRRTVARTLNKLDDRNYIHHTDEGYRLTGYGGELIETYEEYTERVRIAERYQPVLGNVDGEFLEFDLSALQGASLFVADDASPYALLDRTLELRKEATRIRELAPAVEKRSLEQVRERIQRDDLETFEVILTAETAEVAFSHPEYDPVTTVDGVRQYVYDGEFPLFVAVIDDTVLLGVTVDQKPSAMIETTDETIREWAEETIDEFRAAAVPLEQAKM